MLKHQHPSNNSVLGAPLGMPIDQCGALPVTRIEYEDGTPAIASFWMPTAEERALIAAGAPIRLTILGRTHAPVAVGVDGDDFGL